MDSVEESTRSGWFGKQIAVQIAVYFVHRKSWLTHKKPIRKHFASTIHSKYIYPLPTKHKYTVSLIVVVLWPS